MTDTPSIGAIFEDITISMIRNTQQTSILDEIQGMSVEDMASVQPIELPPEVIQTIFGQNTWVTRVLPHPREKMNDQDAYLDRLGIDE